MTQTSSKQSPRERLLQLVARYHAANKNNSALAAEDQEELESLVMSELRMPLDKAKNLLVHLVQYNEEDASEESPEIEGEEIEDEELEDERLSDDSKDK